MGMNTGKLVKLVEETLSEGKKDVEQVKDTLLNNAIEMSEKEFVEFLSDATPYKPNDLKKLFKDYLAMDPTDREDTIEDPTFSKNYLKRFNIK